MDKIPTHKPVAETAAETTEIAKHKKSKLKFQQEFMNEIIAINYFKYQNPSFLVKDSISAEQNKNEKTVNNVNNGLIDLRNDFKRKEITENENPKKVVDIVEKIIDFNKQQKGKRIKILTPKQVLQRLPIALAQVKAGNTSNNLINETRQIICSLYQKKKKLLKKYRTI